MNSPSTHFVSSRRMGVYDPIQQINMWEENFKSNGNLGALICEANGKLINQTEDASHNTLGTSKMYGQEANKPVDKVDVDGWKNTQIQRRLAQNREAARKSRLRKKAYVKQLESSRVKLMQLEQELNRARQQGLCMGWALDSNNLGFAGTVNSGITTFEMEYGHWVEEQNRLICELRGALNAHTSDMELRILVDSIMNHYFELYRKKSAAAKADVFYVMFGMWKTTAERFFMWIGGFRPSKLLKVVVPLIEPLTEQQRFDISNLEQSCQQAEDALSQGMDKLQQTLGDTVAAGPLVEGTCFPQLAAAMEKMEALVSFVNQADHLRQETLQQMFRILTIRQAARYLLTVGEYFQRLRSLNSILANRPRELA